MLAACSGGADSQADPGTASGGNSSGGTAVVTAGTAATPVGGGNGAGAGTAAIAGSPAGGGSSGVAGGGGSSSAGSAGMPSAGTGSGGAVSAGALTVTPAEGLWTGVRYYTGTTPGGRTSGPQAPPEKAFKLHNAGSTALALTLSLTGADAARFKITAPAAPQLNLAPGADAEVKLSIITNNAMLGAAPEQKDGATVLNAALDVTGGAQKLSVRNYALVLTYVELEPTFGQILKAFPAWTTKLPSWLPDNANPNPGNPLPGVVAATDEVAAPAFERLDATKPVTFRAIARFSPPGLVPFGWYEPGKIASRTTAATMAQVEDAHTNDKSRLLDPPLASGNISFEPTVAKFGIWMAPAGVGLLTSNDADGFDGQHRVRSWTLRDAAGAVVPGSFLIGGEEAANGDYQDYVLVLTNVKPSP